jgi:hypothetical protein
MNIQRIICSVLAWTSATLVTGLAEPLFEGTSFLTPLNRICSTIDITSDPAGNAVIALVDRPTHDSSSFRNHVVNKVSPSGQVLWSYRLLPHIKGLATDKDGSVYAAGVRLGVVADPIASNYFQNVGITPHGDGTGYVAKLSSDGVLQWVRQFGGTAPANTLADVVLFDSEGQYYVAGQYRAGTVIGGRELPAPSSNWGVYVAKFAADGQALWVRTGSGSSPELNLVNRVIRSAGFNLDRHGNLNLRFHRLAPYPDNSSITGTGPYFARFAPDGRLLLSFATPEEGPGTSDLDGDFFTAGYGTENGRQGAEIYQEPGILSVRKYAATGELVWTREVESPEFAAFSLRQLRTARS